jgi:hypothetical protein
MGFLFPFSFFFIILSIFDYAKNDVNKKYFSTLFIFLILFCFVFLAGGRNIPRSDYSYYKAFFEAAPKFGNFNHLEPINYGFEPGYLVLNSLIKLFTANYIAYFFIYEILSCILLLSSIKKYTKYKLSFLCLYYPYIFLSLDLILIRSLLAVQLFFFSLRYIYNKDLLRYFICILLASTIHISSVVLFPLLYLLNRHCKNKTALMIIGVGVILTLLRIDILRYILKLLPSFLGRIYIKTQGYLSSNAHGTMRPISFIHLEYLLWFSILIKFRTKLNIFTPYFNIFFNMYIIYGILLFYFFGVNAFSGRLRFFFSPAILFLVPYFIQLFKKCFILSFSCFSLYIIILTIYILFRWPDVLILYKNFFLNLS